MAEPAHLPPEEEQSVVMDGDDVALFFARHRIALLGGGAVVLALAAAVVWWLLSSYNARIDSEALLAEASGAEQWQEVAAKYPGTAAAGDALLLIAKAQRDDGKFQESSETYSQFLSQYPKHPMTGAARLGLAENLEAQNKTAEALKALQLVRLEDAASYAAPYAMLMEARILLRQSKAAEARRVFNDLVSQYPGSPCANVAAAELDRLAEITGEASMLSATPAITP